MKTAIKWRECHISKPPKKGRYILCFAILDKKGHYQTYDWCESKYNPTTDTWDIPCTYPKTSTLLPYRWANILLPNKPNIGLLKEQYNLQH